VIAPTDSPSAATSPVPTAPAASALPAAPNNARRDAAASRQPSPTLVPQISPPPPHAPSAAPPIWIGPALSQPAARQYRLRAVFECGKLDPQVADTPVLAPFPLMLAPSAWQEVARLAEALSSEAIAAERELLARTDLHRTLALPRAVRRALSRCTPPSADSGPRLSRLDLHWAADDESPAIPAWRLSEINADVPGGLIEAGPLARLMLDIGGPPLGRAALAPDPGAALAYALALRLRDSAATDPLVALVHATAYADDFQVMRRAQHCLNAVGLRSVLAAPDHLAWQTPGQAPMHAPTGQRVDAVIRFFPAEWLPQLGRRNRWERFFGPPEPSTRSTPAVLLSNPATAVLVQSKRWSLLWDRLTTPVPTWRQLLPETRDPRELRPRRQLRPVGHPRTPSTAASAHWVLKPAMGRVGEGVLVPGVASPHERALRRAARRDPASWVAQRRFHSIPLDSPVGPLHVCLGVYVVDGRAAGLYARASTRALIDQAAYELPVLIDHSATQTTPNWSPHDRA